jgi:hypothetical protein
MRRAAPDDLLCNHFNLCAGLFLTAVRMVRARLRNPPYTARDRHCRSISKRSPTESNRQR